MSMAVVVPPESQKPIAIDTMFISEAALPPKTGETSAWKRCFDAAALMVTETTSGAPKATLEGRFGRIWVTTGLPSFDGRTRTDPIAATAARQYVDRMLNKNLRVLVGVAWGTKFGRTVATDHWLAITGRGYERDGRVFYSFKDPGTALEALGQGRLYVDGATGKMFRLGSRPRAGGAVLSNYEVTEVRTYKEFPPPRH